MHMPFESLEHIAIDGLTLEGMLVVPAKAQGLVLFAHGSGSSRHSPRNNFVARVLQDHGLATVLMDLLTPEEDQRPQARFDIALLTARLVGALDAEVLVLNRQAAWQMHGQVQLTVVPGATHLFEEPGTLEAVARHANGWFGRHLRPGC